MELEKFEFHNFNKCASLITQYLEQQNFIKVSKILGIMSAVWRRNSSKQYVEIVIVDSSLTISIGVLNQIVYMQTE